MDSFKLALLKALIHGVEVAAVAVVVVMLLNQFSSDPEVHKALKELLMMALTVGGASVLPALLRKWKLAPVPDFNNIKK